MEAKGALEYVEPRFIPWVYWFMRLASPIYDRLIEGIDRFRTRGGERLIRACQRFYQGGLPDPAHRGPAGDQPPERHPGGQRRAEHAVAGRHPPAHFPDPLAFIVAGIVLIGFYSITAERHRQLVLEIQARQPAI